MPVAEFDHLTGCEVFEQYVYCLGIALVLIGDGLVGRALLLFPDSVATQTAVCTRKLLSRDRIH